MEITIVRHGESLWNAGISKDLDSILTPRGVSQANETAKLFIDESKTFGPFDYAFISPFRRTLQTFYPSRPTVKNQPVVYPEVCEFINKRGGMYNNFVGLCKDKIETDFTEMDASATLRNNGVWWPADGEDHDELRKRTKGVAADLREKYGDSTARILIVSHADTIGRLVQAFTGLPDLENGSPPTVDNCSIWRIRAGSQIDDFELILSNDITHLEKADISTRLSLNP
jgi:broad specificity phosphatase PhoE